jgi:acyl carrier protein
MTEVNLQVPSETIDLLPASLLKLQSLAAEDIHDWLVVQIAAQLKVDPDEIDMRAPFSSYGLSSLQAMSIATLGKEQLGLPLSPLVIWNFPNVESLSQFLATELAASAVERFEI